MQHVIRANVTKVPSSTKVKGTYEKEKTYTWATYLPRWLVRKIPREGRLAILREAAVAGAATDGSKVTLGQVSVDRRGDPPVCVTLRFFPDELEILRSFGKKALLSTQASILRTAIFVGLELPGVLRGVISPPEKLEPRLE